MKLCDDFRLVEVEICNELSQKLRLRFCVIRTLKEQRNLLECISNWFQVVISFEMENCFSDKKIINDSQFCYIDIQCVVASSLCNIL